jgi:hypothetical protein
MIPKSTLRMATARFVETTRHCALNWVAFDGGEVTRRVMVFSPRSWGDPFDGLFSSVVAWSLCYGLCKPYIVWVVSRQYASGFASY